MNGLPEARTAQTKTDLHPRVSKAFGLYQCASPSHPHKRRLRTISETPLIFSPPISAASGCNVFLKLENTQPSGSFKSRGIGHLCHLSSLDHRERTHLVCSSSGNAALAVGHAARMLQLKATACVHSGTSMAVRERLKARGCHVAVAEGQGWEFADLLARQVCAEDEYAVYIPPFDHEEVIRGASEIVRELWEKWDEHFPRHSVRPIRPDAVICSVGGGGLLAGILEGMRKAEWQSVPVLAVESEKTASLLASLRASWKHNPPIATPTKIDKLGAGTICHSLGSRWATPFAVQRCIAHVPGQVSHLTVQEARIPGVIRRILEDHHFLVEPACAIALAPLYPPTGAINPREVLDAAIPSLKRLERPNIVVIFCGGAFASLDALDEWDALFALESEQDFRTFTKGREETVTWHV